MNWKNRIVGEGTADPATLLPNPENWRLHSDLQQKVLSAGLDDVGFVQSVIVNSRTGRLVDGHLRASLAIDRGMREIPVTYVELSDAEERLALAVLDPLSGMAESNAHLFGRLLEQATTGNADLMTYLNEFAQRIGAVEDESDPKERTGAKEQGEDDFSGFEHECPECGFQFD